MPRSTFLVAVVARERDAAIHRILALDPTTLIGREMNPSTFVARTAITAFAIDSIAGVAHVFELDGEGKVADTYGPALALQRKKDQAQKEGNRPALLRLDKEVKEELARLRSEGKLGAEEAA